MPLDLLARSCGTRSGRDVADTETARRLDSIAAAPHIQFDGDHNANGVTRGLGKRNDAQQDRQVWAHRAGVNALTIDRFEERYMLSGGSDASILLWDLESDDTAADSDESSRSTVYRPSGRIDKTSSSSSSSSSTHQFGITHLSFYPFDSLAFLSTSYDQTLKIYSTEKLVSSASFDLGSVIYSHAISTIADHLLVACATQGSTVRLVDMRSGVNAHSLTGHRGAVLSVAWSPRSEHLLASGGSDGTARLWDIRRSAGSLGVLDLEDSVGLGGEDGMGLHARSKWQGKAHVGPCNGVVWRADGNYLVTAGHDERVRVWNVALGANALSHFGPIIKNTNIATLQPLLVPGFSGPYGTSTMMYPNEKEILFFDLFEGTLLKRLRVPSSMTAQASTGVGRRNVQTKVTSLAWRASHQELYSSHSDGLIRSWRPHTAIDADLDVEETAPEDASFEGERKRKRQALDDMFRDLTKQKITFT